MKVALVCPVCSTPYEADTERIRWGRQKTCSRKCSYIFRGSQQRNGIETQCAVCSKGLYRPKNRLERANSQYCSPTCRSIGKKNGRQISCVVCDKAFYIYKARLNRANKYCSHKCYGLANRGEANINYKGGTINKRGYRRIRVDGKSHYEHRYLMEKHLGRKLERWEDVHHIDGDKLHNDVTNLRVLSKRAHTLLHSSQH